MKKPNGFGLVAVIIIMIITSVVASITTGVIMQNSKNVKYTNITDDNELNEFINVYDTILSKYYDEVDKEGMLNAAEEGMLNYLGDKYTTYLDDTEYQDILDELSATYSGIGIELSGNIVVGVTSGSPAEKVGILVGDRITTIDGIDVSQYNGNISDMVKNNKKSTVSIQVSRNDELLTFNDIKKEQLINKTISYKMLNDSTIGYLYISKFSEGLDSQVDNALKDLENRGMTSLIIDVRDNVGGFLTSAEDTASLFLEKGKIIYSLQTSDNNLTYKDKTNEKKTYPIIVLINNASASAAEILAAALKDSYGATLVGVKTYGKGKVQKVMKLENGDSVKYTSAKWLTPNGVCIDGVGISPDYYVEYTYESGVDDQLNKAIELLNGAN